MIEKWKQIIGFEGLYDVSNLGRIKSFVRSKVLGEVLSPVTNSIGYLGVTLCQNGYQYRRAVHRIVLEAFVGPCPNGMEGCHNDDDKTNNNLFNLRWDTHQNNVQDRRINGGFSLGSHHGRAKLTEVKVEKIKQLFQLGRYQQKEIAALFGVSRSTINYIVRGKTWVHVK